MPAIEPVFLVVAVLVVGLCVGSFLNVVIYRLPKMMERAWRRDAVEILAEATPAPAEKPAMTEDKPFNLAIPRSACPQCGHQITATENIPVISYLALRGKCSACKTPISLRYPAVELATGITAAYAAWHFGLSLQTAGALLLIFYLVALALIDFDTQLLPDSMTLPLLWFGLAFNLFGAYTDLSSAVIGAMVGYLSLWSVYWLFKLATGKEGMGYGDFKLLAALGAWLGWKMIPVIIVLSSVVGAGLGILLIVIQGRDKQVPMPFGPFLAAAGAIALFWGEPIARRIFSIL